LEDVGAATSGGDEDMGGLDGVFPEEDGMGRVFMGVWEISGAFRAAEGVQCHCGEEGDKIAGAWEGTS
jgi:hypothetical protein